MYVIRFPETKTALYGPFKTVAAAEKWAKQNFNTSTWVIQTIVKP